MIIFFKVLHNSKSRWVAASMVAMMLNSTCFGILSAQATELNQNPANSTVISSSGKKGGGSRPAPPMDPYCPNGAVGPVTDEQITKPCKVGGKDGSKICYIKIQRCLSGPGEDDYAQTENCGKCMVLPGGTPGQTQTLNQD